MFHRTRSVLMASVILVLGFSSFAVARTGDPLREGQRNGTTTRETSIVSSVAATTAKTGGFSTRQSNTSTTGGGAIYGCRASSATTSNPCVRANNLSSGRAFEFNATSGPSAGTITLGTGGDSKKPFTTNATGVATGLNADRVDGQSADQIIAAARTATALNADTVDGLGSSQLRTRWALVNAAGVIERQSGGFSVTAGYPAAPAAANGNVYINTGDDLADNAIVATISLQNGVNQGGGTQNGVNSDGDADGAPDPAPSAGDNLEFSGEIAAAKCNTPGVVTCAPAGTNTDTHLVVSPRLSNGERTSDGNRKRFFVTVTE